MRRATPEGDGRNGQKNGVPRWMQQQRGSERKPSRIKLQPGRSASSVDPGPPITEHRWLQLHNAKSAAPKLCPFRHE